MNFKTYFLNEMFVHGIVKNDSIVVAFDKNIWILDNDNIDKTANEIIDFIFTDLGLDDERDDIKSIRNIDDVYDFATQLQQKFPDILVGTIRNKDLYLYDYGNFKLDPKSSVLVKKVVNQLKLKSASFLDDYDSTETKIQKRKMLMTIPDVAYHGTSTKYIEKIIKLGLRPDKAPSNYAKQNVIHEGLIFFSTRFGEALHHSVHTANITNSRPIIVQFKIPDKDLIISDYDVEKLADDDKYYSHIQGNVNIHDTTYKKDGFKVSKEFGIYGYRGSIMPSFIQTLWVSMKPTEQTYTIADYKKMTTKMFLRYLDYGYFD